MDLKDNKNKFLDSFLKEKESKLANKKAKTGPKRVRYSRPMDPEDIKAFREAYGFTIEEFAMVLNVSASTVKNWESGLCSPSRKHVYAITAIAVSLRLPGNPLDDAKNAVYIGDFTEEEKILIRKLIKVIRDLKNKKKK